MSNEIALRQTGLSRGDARTVGRGLARLEAQARLELARIDTEANLQVARAQAVVYVTRQAMQGAALISEAEAQLGDLLPEARNRIQGIADIGCYALAELVADAGKRVTR